MANVNVFANKAIKKYYGNLEIKNNKIISSLNYGAIKNALTEDYKDYAGYNDNVEVKSDCVVIYQFLNNKNRYFIYESVDIIDIVRLLKEENKSDLPLLLKMYNHNSVHVDLNKLDGSKDKQDVLNIYMTILVNNKLLTAIRNQRKQDLQILGSVLNCHKLIMNAKNDNTIEDILDIIDGNAFGGKFHNYLRKNYGFYFNDDEEKFVYNTANKESYPLSKAKKVILLHLNDFWNF